MRILIVNNDYLQAEGLKNILHEIGLADIEIATCHTEAEKLFQELEPKIVIVCNSKWMDDSLRNAETASFVFIVTNIDPKELAALMANRVAAILHITDAKESLIHCLTPNSGKPFLSLRIHEVVGLTPTDYHPLTLLSKTEMKVASLILQGYSNKCMAARLLCSYLTIKDHRKHIKDKLSIIGGKNKLLDDLTPYASWVVNSANGR